MLCNGPNNYDIILSFKGIGSDLAAAFLTMQGRWSIFSIEVPFAGSIRFLLQTRHDRCQLQGPGRGRRYGMERKGLITMKGRPLTLLGTDTGVGDKAPDFTVLDKDLSEVKLGDFAGKIKIISVTPSLDTAVCDLQLRRFNSEAASLPHDVVVLNISMDLPFAVARFCTTAEIERARALSDHREASFGTAYGVLIKELRLLARSIFIIDKNNIVRYREIVAEETNHPDYEKALRALGEITEAAKAA
jgi:thioredoxin-dependent peroxiredoxin